MRDVLCFGEALIDFLNTGEQVDEHLRLKKFTQFPGGAPANAAVAVAKLGGQARFAGQVGDDYFGHFLIQALKQYKVDTRLTAVHPTAKTPLAFVFLDESGERSFSFHRDRTADLVFNRDQVSEDWFSGEPLLHYCSNTLTDASIAGVTRHIVDRGRQHNCPISFDVNLRHNLWPGNSADASLVSEFVERADVVKFALEELDYLSNGQRQAYIDHCLGAGVKLLIVTDGGNPIRYYCSEAGGEIAPPPVSVVDTTGGGDAFIGAVLFRLGGLADPLAFLESLQQPGTREQLEEIIAFASHCGALTISRQGAFPALPTRDEIGNG